MARTDIAIDMVREMARHVDAGSSADEIAATIRKAFPTATAAHAAVNADWPRPNNDVWEDQRQEDIAGSAVDLPS